MIRMPAVRVLVADDDPGVLELLRAVLGAEDWDVQTASDGLAALRLLGRTRFDVAVLDLAMPGLNGLQVLKAIRRKGIDTDVVILTGFGSVEGAVVAMKTGAREFLEKPIRQEQLTGTVRKLVEARHPRPNVLAERLDRRLRDFAPSASVTLTVFARQVGLSPGYVSRLLRERFGGSFHRRLAHHRVQIAKALLVSTTEPIKAVAALSGFRNQRRLTEAFRRLERVSPKRYRESGVDTRKNDR
jgi:YesN/AraC family two-component response regulator